MHRLPQLTAIRASGEGAAAFLDAQLTQKVSDLAEGELRLAAWCNPQGRVRALFRVLRGADAAFALVLPTDLAEPTCVALARFILRAPVRVAQEASPVCEASGLGADALAGLVHGAHPRDPARRLAIAPPPGPAATAADDRPGTGGDASLAWRAADIRAGLPQVFAASTGRWLPQNLDLEALGGLSYTKGCYPGQEIVARLHYRGTLKQVLCRLEREADGGDLPSPGDPLTDGAGTRAGEVVDAVAAGEGCALALAVVDIAAAGAALYGAGPRTGRQGWRTVAAAAAEGAP